MFPYQSLTCLSHYWIELWLDWTRFVLASFSTKLPLMDCSSPQNSANNNNNNDNNESNQIEPNRNYQIGNQACSLNWLPLTQKSQSSEKWNGDLFPSPSGPGYLDGNLKKCGFSAALSVYLAYALDHFRATLHQIKPSYRFVSYTMWLFTMSVEGLQNWSETVWSHSSIWAINLSPVAVANGNN